MSFHTWILSNEAIYDTVDIRYDNVFSVLHTLTGFVVNILSVIIGSLKDPNLQHKLRIFRIIQRRLMMTNKYHLPYHYR